MMESERSATLDRTPLERIDRLMRSGATERWHTERGVPGQSVADHCWRSLQILKVLCGGTIAISPGLVWHVLDHDNPETFTGDTPAPAKWAHPELKDALDACDGEWMHRHGVEDTAQHDRTAGYVSSLLDKFEPAVYCLEQLQGGNHHATWAFVKLVTVIPAAIQVGVGYVPDKLCETATQLLEELQIAWEAAGGKWPSEEEVVHHG